MGRIAPVTINGTKRLRLNQTSASGGTSIPDGMINATILKKTKVNIGNRKNPITDANATSFRLIGCVRNVLSCSTKGVVAVAFFFSAMIPRTTPVSIRLMASTIVVA
jgi:hypothetical protein